MKKIGILTSGGDAPGMNAVINGVVTAASELEIEVVGFVNGYDGLINNEVMPLPISYVKQINADIYQISDPELMGMVDEIKKMNKKVIVFGAGPKVGRCFMRRTAVDIVSDGNTPAFNVGLDVCKHVRHDLVKTVFCIIHF